MVKRLLIKILYGSAAIAGWAAGQTPVLPVGEDQLVPVSGHPLFGSLSGASDGTVTFEVDAGASISLPWAKVKSIHRKGPIYLETSQVPAALPLIFGEATLESDGSTVMIIGGGETRSLKISAITSLTTTPPKLPPTVTWTGSISPKFSLAMGTQSVQTIGGAMFIRRAQNTKETDWKHQETSLSIEGTNSLTEQAGSPSVRIHEYDGEFAHSIYLFDGLYAAIRAEDYHNTALNLYLQQMYGGGVGKRVYADKNVSLELLADGLFVTEHFYGATGATFGAARFGDRLGLRIGKLKGGPMVISQGIGYIPAFEQAKAWQVRGTAILDLPVTKAFSLSVNFADNYLENAPNGRKNYSSSTVGLNFTLNP